METRKKFFCAPKDTTDNKKTTHSMGENICKSYI